MSTNQHRRFSVFLKLALVLALIVISPAIAAAQVWTVLTFDGQGDGRDPSLADAAQLAYRYDKQQDMLWFRIALYGQPNKDAFGVSLVIDTGADDSTKMNWWGANKTFKFDRLVTASVMRGDKGFEGTIGVGDVAGVNAKHCGFHPESETCRGIRCSVQDGFPASLQDFYLVNADMM